MRNGSEESVTTTSALLEELSGRFTGDSVSVAELTAALGDRGPATLLLLLTLPGLVPLPGVPAGMIFGTVIILLSLQMLSGREQLWLPQWLARRRIGRGVFLACLRGAKAPLARLESRLRPRWRSLAGPHMLRPLAPLVFLMGVLIALPIPFGNVVPGLALIAVSLGILTRDGAAVGAGLALAVAAALVCIGLAAAGWALAAGA